jgi:ribose 5-phosphate isomerase B
MKIYLASDHAGWKLKNKIKKYLEKKHNIIDYTEELDKKDDYPYYAKKLAKTISKTKERGILICGSGIGMSIAANRIKGIRATLCRTIKETKYSRKHNNSNILCLGQKFTIDNPENIVNTWIKEKFDGGRHQRRLKKIDE